MQLMTKMKYLSNVKFKWGKNIYCIRMNSTLIYSQRSNYKYGKQKHELRQIFLQYTNIKPSDMKHILQDCNAHYLSPTAVERKLNICKNLSVDVIGSDVDFLELSEEELINRILILREIGANHITSPMIKKLTGITPVTSLKAYAGIPKGVNIVNLLYSHLHKPPSHVPPLENMDEFSCLHVLRKKCLDHYFRWRFELPNKIKNLENYISKFRYIPFASIKDSFDVLHKDGKMPIDMIWNHKCLIDCSPDDMRKIISEIPRVCNVPLTKLLKISPLLHKMKYNDVVFIKKYLEDHNITSKQIENHPDVLVQDKMKFLQNWKAVMKIPEILVLMKNPNALKLFTLEDIVSRIEYLQYLNISHVTLSMLIKPSQSFDNSMKSGRFNDHTKDICLFIESALNLSSSYSNKILNDHPYWRLANIFDTINTLDYLQTQFKNEDIVENLYLLLYPKNKVKYVLENLIHKNELMDESDRYTSSQLMSLCLYEIEKTYHFTGDGLWEEYHEQTYSNESNIIEDKMG